MHLSSKCTPTVALFMPTLFGGGAERAMLRLARGMLERGAAVELVLVSSKGHLLSELPAGVRVVDLGARRVATSILALARYLRRAKPPVMLSAMDHANVSALLARRLSGASTRLVVAVHAPLSAEMRDGPSLKRRAIHRLMRWCYPWADAVVAVSQGVGDDTARVTGVPRNRIHVIYNPIIDDELLTKAKAPVDHPWFKPGQPRVILAVGNLSPWKDFATLLRAFAIVRQQQRFRLMVLGEGQERASLETLSRDLGVAEDVSLPGFVDNPYTYMAKAAVLVLSSRWEAAPTVLVEAMALGTPVVSTDCDFGPRELLARGEYGRLVPLGDPHALAAGVLAAAAASPPSVPAGFLQQFAIETSTRQYLQLLAGEEYA